MDKKYFLAIDRGQTGIKAAFCDSRANVIYMESLRCQPIQSPKSGWAQQDMNLMWEQTKSLIGTLFRTSGVSPKAVAAVSFCGQGGGNFLVSKEGKAVYPGVLSMDSRHEEMIHNLENPDNAELPRTLAFMAWLKKYEPEIFAQTRWILGSKDWLRYCLTGIANADMSDTPAPVDLDSGTYMTEGLDVLGIPECEGMLPPLVYASEICGAVTKKAAEETGLMEGTPVVAGAHDMIACSAGAGGNKQGHLTVIMGTLGINIAVVDKDTILPGICHLGESFVFGGIARAQRTVTTSIGSACNSMDWFLNLFFEKEKKEAEEKGITVFELLENTLSKEKISPVIFQPFLMGTFYNSSAKAGLLGLTAQTTREDIVLALYSGICISMCIEIERLEWRTGELENIWLVGGGSRSVLWGQMFADVLGRPVHICRDSEVGLRGSAICAGIALGYYTIQEGFPKPESKLTYTPRADMTRKYKKQIKRYKEAYDMSGNLWNQI